MSTDHIILLTLASAAVSGATFFFIGTRHGDKRSYPVGHEAGYNVGRREGYEKGFSEGRDTGWQDREIEQGRRDRARRDRSGRFIALKAKKEGCAA